MDDFETLSSQLAKEGTRGFFGHYGVVNQFISHYEHFFDVEIHEVFRARASKVPVGPWLFSITNPRLKTPATLMEADGTETRLSPVSCQQRGITYATDLLVDLVFEHTQSKQVFREHAVRLCAIPVMVNSRFCNLNAPLVGVRRNHGELATRFGGSFVINGTDRCFMNQENNAGNVPIITPPTGKMQDNATAVLTYRIVTMRRTSSITLYMGRDRNVMVAISCWERDRVLPLVVLMRALGVLSNERIWYYLTGDYEVSVSGKPNAFLKERPGYGDVVRASIRAARSHRTQASALDAVAKFFLSNYRHHDTAPRQLSVLHYEFLQNLNGLNETYDPGAHSAYESWRARMTYLGVLFRQLVRRTVDVDGPIQFDDRDHMSVRHITTVEMGFTTTIRKHLSALVRFVLRDLRKRVASLRHESTKGKGKSAKTKGKSTKTKDRKSWATQIMSLDVEARIILQQTPQTFLHYDKLDRDIRNMFIGKLNKASGVVQHISDAHNMQGILEQHRRIGGPSSKQSSKLAKMRQVTPSHWGIKCPTTTPEGENCGMITHLALSGIITRNHSPIPLWVACREYGVHMGVYGIPSSAWTVIINGDAIGYVDTSQDASALATHLRRLRTAGILEFEISISVSRNDQAAIFWTVGGRLTRPCLHIKNICGAGREYFQKHAPGLYSSRSSADDRKTIFDTMLRMGLVVLIDKSEETGVRIYTDGVPVVDLASGLKWYEIYDYMELNPSLIVGMSTAMIPYPEHNQAPRNTYHNAMKKQAMSVRDYNIHAQVPTKSYQLWYPQKPLVSTKLQQELNLIPAGMCPIVAIASYEGFNEEDAIVMSRKSAQLGLGVATCIFTRTEKEEDPISGNMVLHIGMGKPPDDPDTAHLDNDGLPVRGTYIGPKMVFMCMTLAPDGASSAPANTRYSFVRMGVGEEGTVDNVLLSNRPGSSRRQVKVKFRATRLPELGSKFTSDHGQKGTIGALEHPENLPFMKSGMTPDIIINPHAMPRRKTIGQMIEMLAGRAVTELAMQVDATIFRDKTIETNNIDGLVDVLTNALGMEHAGYEDMMSGTTGRKIRARIFIGPCFYQRLKHMASDVIHVRGRITAGSETHSQTRQPIKGRKRGGGIRFGGMDRDAVFGQGASSFLRERLTTCSDEIPMVMCQDCHYTAYEINYNPDESDTPEARHGHVGQCHAEPDTTRWYRCSYCKREGKASAFQHSTIPYAAKLMFSELVAIGISARLS